MQEFVITSQNSCNLYTIHTHTLLLLISLPIRRDQNKVTLSLYIYDVIAIGTCILWLCVCVRIQMGYKNGEVSN